MKKWIFGLMALLAMGGALHAQVGTRIQSVTVVTNSGVVSFGTNSYSVISITNNVAFSNKVSVVGTFNAEGLSTFKSAVVVSNAMQFISTNIALTAVTNNDFPVFGVNYLVITNQTQTNTVFTGFSGGRDGQPLIINNLTSTNTYFISASSMSAATNQFDMMGLGTTNTTQKGTFEFIYNGNNSNWVLRSFIP